MSSSRKAAMRAQRKRANEHARKQWIGFIIILVMLISLIIAVIASTLNR